MYNTTKFVPKEEVANEYRAMRYKRQAISAKYARETGHAVINCMKAMTGAFVEVGVSKSTGRAHFSGLVTCGSVWDCPICSAKISMQRKEEINQAVQKWHDKGGKTVMVTFTIQHNRRDTLEELSEVTTNAIRFVKSGAPYQRKKDAYGIEGSITATEVTYSAVNGWHFHKHVALFLNGSHFLPNDFQNWLYERYNKYLVKHGHYVKKGVGVKVSVHIEEKEENIGSYMTKWALDSELTLNEDKLEGGLTPFMLLDHPELKNKWMEYTRAMFGKRRLTWSRGLKELLEVDVIEDDAEIAEKEEIEETDIKYRILIMKHEWFYIRKNNMQVQLLEICERGETYARGWFIEHVVNRCRPG